MFKSIENFIKTGKFLNRENACIKHEGKEYWISRSPAVVGATIALVGDEIYFLIIKRSPIMEVPNKWALPSGYLDWDESGYEAIVRELYEETGFNVPINDSKLIYDNNKEPFFVQSDPEKDARQNVSLSYVFVFKFDELPDLSANVNSEISEIKWLNLKEFFSKGDEIDWAFNHHERINYTIEKFLSNNS